MLNLKTANPLSITLPPTVLALGMQDRRGVRGPLFLGLPLVELPYGRGLNSRGPRRVEGP